MKKQLIPREEKKVNTLEMLYKLTNNEYIGRMLKSKK